MIPIDILLLNVHRRYLNFKVSYGGFLGIYILAAFLRKMGYNAKSFSGTLQEGKDLIDKLCGDEKKVAVVGFYTDYENVSENIFLSRYIKDNYSLPVLIGGPQATALTEDFFEKSGCDAIARYEGELTLLELMNYFLEDEGSLKDILGIAYMEGGALHINGERPLITNLDTLPFIDEECYLREEDFFRGLSVMTGRGCPFSCSFCHEGTHTRTVRFRSIENVLAEIDIYLKKNARDDLYILFTDDTLTLKPERLHELCVGIADRRKTRKFKWFCEGHVNTLYHHPEMIDDLAMAGCTRLQLGIEAGTEFVLKSYGKHTTPEEIFTVVEKCRDAGISQIFGNIILAGTHFNKDIYEADKKFVEKLIRLSQGTVEISVVSFWPLPETPMTKRPEKYGIKICDKEFITSVGDFPQAETEELDRYEIARMQKDFEMMITELMMDMLENWEVPTERVLSWFYKSQFKEGYGGWYLALSKNEILFSYYEMLYLGEGMDSKHVKDIEAAHPLRLGFLYRHIITNEDGSIEIRGEKFTKQERDIVLLTTGKLSVKEIMQRTANDLETVLSVLGRLEKKHFIVYVL